MDNVKIGKFIKELRTEKNLTQEELANQIGSTYKTISRWENGNYMPPVDMLMELGKIFDVSLNELLNGERIEEKNYKEIAEKNIADIKKENERKSLVVFSVTAVIIFATLIVVFAVLDIVTKNKSFQLAAQVILLCMLGSYIGFYFSIIRFSKGQSKTTYTIILICDCLGLVANIISMVLNIVENIW